MHKAVISLYISLFISLVLLFMEFYVLSAFLLCVTLCTCMGSQGFKSFALMAVVSAAAVYLVCGMSLNMVLIFCAIVIPVSFLIGFGFYKDKTFAWTVAPAALAETLVIAWIIYEKMKNTSSSAVTVLFGSWFQNLKMMKNMLPAGVDIDEFIKFAYIQMEIILPALLVIAAGLLSIMVYLISMKYLRKSGKELMWLPSLSELYLNRGFTGIYMVILLTIWFAGSGAILENVYLVVSGMFVFCGFSLCTYWLSKTGMPKILQIIIILTAIPVSLMLVFPIMILSFLGLIDSTRNFRNLKFEAGKLVRQ